MTTNEPYYDTYVTEGQILSTIFTSNDTNGTTATNGVGTTVHNPSFAKYYPLLISEMCLSIFCLTFLIFIYYRIKEHRTIPGKIVISLSACFIACYVLLVVDFSLRTRIAIVPCLLVSLLVHVLFLAAFFWTNVMAYDIMRTMSSIKSSSLTGPSARFWKYALYAWTMTLVCSLPAFVVDNIRHVPDEHRPNFGRNRCWLSGEKAFLLYFMGPVGLILLANCCMFGLTALTILKVKKDAVAAHVKTQRTRFGLYIRLVIVMGLVWIAEFIPMISGLYYLYALAGVSNCLHGVYIFVIFACKQRIWNKFKSTFECAKNKAKAASSPGFAAVFHTSASASTMVSMADASNGGSVDNLNELGHHGKSTFKGVQ